MEQRIDFETEEEYMEYLSKQQEYVDSKCYDPDPLEQFINRRSHYRRDYDC